MRAAGQAWSPEEPSSTEMHQTAMKTCAGFARFCLPCLQLVPTLQVACKILVWQWLDLLFALDFSFVVTACKIFGTSKNVDFCTSLAVLY